MCELERWAQANHCGGLGRIYHWHQNRSSPGFREEHGGYLVTGHAVSGVQVA
jgi:hypothetical protein